MDLDAERDAVVKDLTRHCGDGRLTLDELEERIEEAYAATDESSLRRVLRDLPARPRVATAEPPVAPKLPPTVLDPTPFRVPPDVQVHRDHALRRGQKGTLEHTLKTIWCIAGFVALFNGLWWMAIILWFVVPKLVLPQIRRA